MSERKIVVTGMGCVSPIGNSVDSFWQNSLAGVSGAAFNPLFEAEKYKIPVNFSCQVKDFDPTDYMGAKQARRIDPFLRFSLAASCQAVEDADLNVSNCNPDRVGTLIGTGIGGADSICRWTLDSEKKQDYSRVTPFFVPGVIANMASGEVSIKYGFRGPSLAISTACSSASHCIGESMLMIRHGRCDAMICGGSEFVSLPLLPASFASAKALSRRNDDPQRASRPFDRGRDGFVLGEGAGILVLEEYEHAKKRGAPIYAECLGYAASADAFHITAPSPEGNGAVAGMRGALQDAQMNTDQIDYVNAHGTSTPLGDAIEARALRRVFGDHLDRVPVNSTKSMIGHLLGATGALEALICVKSLTDQKIHPTINVEDQDPECDLDCVKEGARDHKLKTALSNSFGFGGTNACLILGAV